MATISAIHAATLFGAAILSQSAIALDVEFVRAKDAGCKVTSLISINATVTWSGACKGDYAHGTGVAIWSAPFGDRKLRQEYEGRLSHGLPDGAGKMMLANGDVYEGGWRHGARHGFGRLTSKTGRSYAAVWKGNKLHGRGYYQSSAGQKILGEWHMGVFTGWYPTSKQLCEVSWAPHPLGADELAGLLDWSGECIDGKATGYGELRWRDEGGFVVAFTGNVSKGRLTGQGHWESVSQDTEMQQVETYKGSFRNSMWDGSGEWLISVAFGAEAERRTYRGRWRNGRYHGKGRYEARNAETGADSSETYDGEWRMGVRRGYGEFAKIDRTWAGEGNDGQTVTKYRGQWRADEWHGFGQMDFGISGLNGEDEKRYSYRGEFKQGVRSGSGKFSFVEGGSFDGNWIEDVPGKGRCTFPSEDYDGLCMWMSGRPNQPDCFVGGEAGTEASTCLITGQGVFNS